MNFRCICICIVAGVFAITNVDRLDAQEFNWTNAAGTGEWSNANNWNLGGDGFPGDGSDVNINGGLGTTLYQSTGTTNPTTLDLAPGAQLDIQGGKIGFPANGPTNPYSFQNSGEINVLDSAILEARETARNFSTAEINLFPGGTLEVHPDGAWLNTSTQNTGNGTITMSDASITGANTSGALLALTNQSILGDGNIGDNRIGLSLGPNSIIEADVNNLGLTIDVHNTTGISNAGIMRASGGGTLQFTGPTPIDNTGGLIEAQSGSEVRFDSSINITGGTLRRVGTGVFEISPTSGSLGDVALIGTTVRVPNGNLFLVGTVNNGGEILVEETTGGSVTDLQINETVTLTGGGFITLSAILDNSFTARITDDSFFDGILINEDNTIRGRGLVGNGRVQIRNSADGVINADDPAGALTINSTGVAINRGLYSATDGGTLVLTGGDFDNADGLIEPQDDSTIRLSGSANVIGGTLRNFGTGEFVFESSTVTDVTFDGMFTVGTSLNLFLDGTIDNQGEIVVEETSGGSQTDLQINQAASLTGGGVVTLAGIADTFTARITDDSFFDGVLTNVDNTIRGRGLAGSNRVRIVNEAAGVLSGNNPDGPLSVGVTLATPSINRGLITASDGGRLNLVHGEFDNSQGLIEPQSLSTVSVGGTATVDGGILNAADDSTIEFSGSGSVVDVILRSDGSGNYEVPSGSPFIFDSTNESLITVRTSANLGLDGVIENQGEIVVEETSSGSQTDLQINQLVSLTGGGVVTLAGILDNAFTARITDDSFSDGVLTNVDNTIQGRGLVGSNRVQIINQVDGVINANDSSGSLTIDSTGTAINRGEYLASADGRLVLTGGDFDNANGLIESRDDSTIRLSSSANVIGGTVRSVGTGEFEFTSGTITDATLQGVLTIGSSLNLFLDGTIDNQGEIVIEEASGGSQTDLQINNEVSLTGGGVVTLSSIVDNTFTARITDDSFLDGVLTNVDNTIQGRGLVGANRVEIINEMEGTIHANVSGGTLIIDSSDDTFANEGTLVASNGGTLSIIGTLENGVEGIMTGDSIIASTTTILNFGTITPGNSPGTLTINAGLDLGATSSLEIEIENSNMADLLDVNGAIELGGELQVSFLNGFEPASTDTFDILIADSLTGVFSNAANGAQIETSDGKGIVTVNYVGGTVRLSNFVAFTMGQTASVTRGTLAGGSATDLELSDNMDLSIRRSNTDIVSRTEFEIQGTSPLASPTSMSVVLEGSVFARTNVAQRIELYNYMTDSWEIVDSRSSSRFIDSTATVVISGDLTRFVDQSTLEIAARVRYTSGNPRQRFTSNTDQFIWIIQ